MPQSALDFEAVHADFQPRIARYLANLVGEADAADLTQEVFTKVSNALPGFRRESQLSTWIYRIATNAAYDLFRSAAFRARRGCAPLADVEAHLEDHDIWQGEPAEPVPHQMAREEMQACIRDYIWRLPESYRAVLVLSDLEEFTNAEIADVLDLTLGTVKIRLHRGRARLRELLEAACDFYQDERDGFSCEPKGAPPDELDAP